MLNKIWRDPNIFFVTPHTHNKLSSPSQWGSYSHELRRRRRKRKQAYEYFSACLPVGMGQEESSAVISFVSHKVCIL